MILLYSLCRWFTPRLVEWYNAFKKGPNGDLFDIVFVSSDENKHSWRAYFSEMPWHALDFDDREKKACTNEDEQHSCDVTLSVFAE